MEGGRRATGRRLTCPRAELTEAGPGGEQGPEGDEPGLGAGRLAAAVNTHTGPGPFPSSFGKEPRACRLRGEKIKEANLFRASLVAQWLRVCLPMQETRVRALVWEDPTCRGATRPVSHNY